MSRLATDAVSGHVWFDTIRSMAYRTAKLGTNNLEKYDEKGNGKLSGDHYIEQY